MWAVVVGDLVAAQQRIHYGEPNPDCPIEPGIRLAPTPLWRPAEDALTRQLASTTIEDLLTRTLRQHAAS